MTNARLINYCAMDLCPESECGMDCLECEHYRHTFEDAPSQFFNHRVIQPCWVCERDTVQEYDAIDQLYYCQECGAPQVN